MFEVINGFVGLGFAWLMLGIALFPVVTALEWCAAKYILYSTDGDVKIPSIFRRLLDKFCNWIETFKQGEFVAIVIVVAYFFSYAVSLISSYTDHMRHARQTETEMQWLDFIQYALFDVWVPIGVSMSPVLIVVGTALGITYVSRKSFKFKKVLVNHMNNKKVHKDG